MAPRFLSCLFHKTSSSSTCCFVLVAAALWYFFSVVATIAIKSVMDNLCTNSAHLTSSFLDMRWVELTGLQLLLESFLAVIGLKVIGKSVWPSNIQDHKIFIAAIGNVVGNLAINVAYSLLTSSTVQVIRASQFLTSFMLISILNRGDSDCITLCSISLAILGTGGFLLADMNANMWGTLAGVIANAAVILRNIFLKKISSDSTVQKFAVTSIYGMVLLLPLWLIKVLVIGGMSSIRPYAGLASGLFYSFYNLASIALSESVSPFTFVILSISKRLIVVIANAIYFWDPLSPLMIFCLLALFIGSYLYQHPSPRLMCVCSSFTVAMVAIIAVWGYGAESFPVEQFAKSSGTPYTLNKLTSVSSQIEMGRNHCVAENHISVSWVYSKPIPEAYVKNIEHLAEQNPGLPVRVYCGTTQCVNAINGLSSNYITSEFAVISDILKGTHLQVWLAHHPFNKLLAGREFETHLQEVLVMGLLLRYGGFYVSPNVKISEQLSLPMCKTGQDAWVSGGIMASEQSVSELFAVAFFTRNHPFIEMLTQMYVNEYPKEGKSCTPFRFEFHNKVKMLLNISCPFCPTVKRNMKIDQSSDNSTSHWSQENHFGTLSYDSRVRYTRTSNLGDELQGFPGLQFLPFADTAVERDAVRSHRSGGNATIFFNAWWGSSAAQWPPNESINPIMLSIHIGEDMAQMWSDSMWYVKNREPIGCRDSYTLNFMKERDVKAFFSGCLTLLLNNPTAGGKRSGKVYIVDVKQEFVGMLPKDIQSSAVYLKHRMVNGAMSDSLTRFSQVHQLIRLYGDAKLVITQRIHSALPCVAMGTPVIFFNSKGMPGGGGSTASGSSRVSGLTPLFHSIDLYKMTKEQAQEWLQNFPWDQPPPNPDTSLFMRLRASAWNIIRKNPSLYDAGRKFGVIPMRPPVPSREANDLVFHVIFTTPNTTVAGSLNKQKQNFTWRDWRSVESIFYHHPLAQVTVHSNTLSQYTFDVLAEAGYSIKVQTYNLEANLANSPARNFLQTLQQARRDHNWYRQEADLLRLLVLYQQGGIYVDTDVILIRPVDMLMLNSIGWEDSTNTSLNGAFMMFEKGNLYIESCLSKLSERYDANKPAFLLTSMVTNNRNIHVLPYHTIYRIQSSSMARQCFEDPEDEVNDMKIVMLESLGVDINSNISGQFSVDKAETLCGHILRSYCVLCSNVL